MRPPDLPGGNRTRNPAHLARATARFNEAAGFTRRKLSRAMAKEREARALQ